MSYSVSKGNISGRLGTAFGKGLSESLPQEIEHQRLSHGLKNLANKSGELSPEQYLSEAYSVKGITPAMVEQFGRLAERKRQANSLQNIPQPEEQKRQSYPNIPPDPNALPNASTLATPDAVQRAIEGYVRPTTEQENRRAAELYNANPDFYGNDPSKARQAAREESMQNEAIYNDLVKKRDIQNTIEKNIESDLKAAADKHNAKVPEDVYSKVQDKTLNYVNPKSESNPEGGLTERQAREKGVKELDDISREYSALDALTGKPGQWPAKTFSALDSLQSQFKKRGDLRNFRDKIQSGFSIQPEYASYKAYPLKDEPEIAKTIKNAPDISGSFAEKYLRLPGAPKYIGRDDQIREGSMNLSEKLFPLLKKSDTSPLSIAVALKQKGYDPQIWLDYARKNGDELKKWQFDELGKTGSINPGMNDLWLFQYGGGQDLNVEIE